MSNGQSRWDEIRRIHFESATAYRILGGLVLVGIGVWLGANLFAGDAGYGTNLYTEFISIAVTVFIIDILNRRRDERRREQELREQLVLDLHSPNNSTAIEAIHKMHVRDWLSGEESPLRKGVFFEVDWRNAQLSGSDLESAKFFGARLEGADLSAAYLYFAYMSQINLAKAKLRDAYLDCADLSFACLEGTNLSSASLLDTELKSANLNDADCSWANFEGANLEYTTMTYSDFDHVNLEKANLRNANLEGASFCNANLKGASLYDAHLKDVDLVNVKFDENTTLPHGGEWTHDTDMDQFTDPDHCDYWYFHHPYKPTHKEWQVPSSFSS